MEYEVGEEGVMYSNKIKIIITYYLDRYNIKIIFLEQLNLIELCLLNFILIVMQTQKLLTKPFTCFSFMLPQQLSTFKQQNKNNS